MYFNNLYKQEPKTRARVGEFLCHQSKNKVMVAEMYGVYEAPEREGCIIQFSPVNEKFLSWESCYNLGKQLIDMAHNEREHHA